jgi:endonuclease YncB( thermonuclease family)
VKFIALLLLFTSAANAAELRHIRCLDGDTIVASIDLGFDVILDQQTIRIHGYDAWETSYRRQTIRYAPDELAKGALAKAALEKLLTGKVTVQEVAGRDPYGRRLLEVYADGVNVGETLRAQGHERTEKQVSTLKND